MRYKVYVSTEYGDHDTFYFDSKAQARTVFNMAMECKLFDYVSMSELVESERLVDDWSIADE